MSMILSIAIALIILALIFFSLKGLFGYFPDNWEWVGIVLAGVGLAVATPSIFQRAFGKPIAEIEYFRGVDREDRFLSVFLMNPPIKNKFLKMLGVRRETIQSLVVQFRISEQGSNKVIIPIRTARIITDEDSEYTGKDRITLPPTYSVGATCMFVLWDEKKNKALVISNRDEQKELDQGYYAIYISLIVEGEYKKYSATFVVGEKADDLIWGSHK